MGPFTVVPNVGTTYNMEGAPYVQLIGPQRLLGHLLNLNGEDQQFFQVSARHRVTLPDDIRLGAHIPLGENVSFRWVYPFVKTKLSTSDKIKALEPSHPLVALILYGGYLYVDEHDQVLQVNGVKPGPGLYFDGPYKISPACFDLAFKDGRFQECTVELEGCKSFSWFLPGEDAAIKEKTGAFAFTDDEGNEIGIPHGAFGYDCVDGPRLFRISDIIPSGHFPVTEFTSLAHQKNVVSGADGGDSDDVQNCVICLEPYGDGDQRRVVNKPCNHACMHHACANQLLSSGPNRDKCPICRTPVASLERMPFIT